MLETQHRKLDFFFFLGGGGGDNFGSYNYDISKAVLLQDQYILRDLQYHSY